MKPVPKSKKASTKKPKSHKKPLLILLTLLTVAIVVGGVAAYINYRNDQKQKEQAFAADKARFAKVEADMAEAYAAMIAAAGKPETESRNKGCSHVSLKFEQGQLGCWLSYDYTYVALDYNDAIKKLGLINNATLSTRTFTQDPLHRAQILENKDPFRPRERSYLELKLEYDQDITCENRMDISSATALPNNKHLTLKFSCYGDVYSSPVYPLAE